MLETMLTELAAGEGVDLILQKKDINQISYEVANEKAASFGALCGIIDIILLVDLGESQVLTMRLRNKISQSRIGRQHYYD